MPAELSGAWSALAATSLPWLTATLLAYLAADALYRRCGSNPLLHPIVLAVAMLGGLLWATGTRYETYFDGAQVLHFLLGPATVALAVPLHAQLPRLRRMLAPLAAGLLAGGVTGIASAVLVAEWLDASAVTRLSLAAKSITTPVAMGVVSRLGGYDSLTAVIVVVTGIAGAVMARGLLDALRVRDEAVRGFAIGIAAHGVGTARAFQMSERTGAFAGLAMGLNAVLTALLLPLLWRWLGP